MGGPAKLADRTPEQVYALMLLGQEKASALMTDGYKFSMAQAGFPLREETFVFSLRRGGPFFIPFDFAEVIQHLLPDLPTAKEAGFLTANGYGFTPAMEQALRGKVCVTAAPKGSWVGQGEPVLTVTGPSFLVSWLEPLCLMFHYPIQIATALANDGARQEFPYTCGNEASIIQITRTVVENLLDIAANDDIVIYPYLDKGYLGRVRANIKATIDALGGEAERAFEVGLRAATCMEQHLMVLRECRAQGLLKTSNVYGAWLLYMIPVGTSGHEHQERWGMDDAVGFRAIRDTRAEPPSYLFDTNDPMRLGIPAAFVVMKETPSRPCSMRFDSGNQDMQLSDIVRRGGLHLLLNLIFEDGYTADKTRTNESLCDSLDWPRARRMYGYGGFFVSEPSASPYNRDRVSAAFKLCWSAGPRKKFSGTPGKGSLAGTPVIWRRGLEALAEGHPFGGVDSIIAQAGEIPPDGFLLLTAENLGKTQTLPSKIALSPATRRLNDLLGRQRDALLDTYAEV